MKILFITSMDSPHTGGEWVYIEKAQRALQEEGVEIEVLILHTEGQKVSPPNIHTQVIPVIDMYSYQGLCAKNSIYPKLYRHIRKKVLQFAPDVVHLHTTFFLKTVLLATRGIPKIQTFHEISQVDPFYPLFFAVGSSSTYTKHPTLKEARSIGLKMRTILIDHILCGDRRWQKKYIHTFLCPSKHLRQEAEQHGLTPVLHLPYFQDTDHEKTPNENNYTDEYFLFVGRLEIIKGVDQLLQAFSLFKKSHGKARLLIVGDGSQSLRLKLLSKELEVDSSVDFLGWIDNSKISTYYENARGVIIPSVYPEVSPLVAFEAMRHSKPIIAYRVGGLPEIIEHGETGLLVEQGNIQGLSEACKQIYTNPTYAQKLGDAGRKKLEKHYTKKEHVDRLIAIYESLCKL